MKRDFHKFYEEMTGTSAVAGAGDDSSTVPVYLDKKKKKKKPDVVTRFITNRKEQRDKWSK